MYDAAQMRPETSTETKTDTKTDTETDTDVEDYGDPQESSWTPLSPITYSRLIWAAAKKRPRRPARFGIKFKPLVDIVRLCSENSLRQIIAEARLANALH